MMWQASQLFAFTLKTVECLPIECVQESLDGDVRVQLSVKSLPNHTHSTFADNFKQPVTVVRTGFQLGTAEHRNPFSIQYNTARPSAGLFKWQSRTAPGFHDALARS